MDAGGDGQTDGEYRAAVRCSSCSWRIPDPKSWLHDLAAQQEPCPECGAQDAWIAEVGVSDTFHWHEFVGLKGKMPGVKKPRFELQSGDQLEVSTGRWMVKRRLIDRTNDLYEESVIDAKTGEVRHHCSENERWILTACSAGLWTWRPSASTLVGVDRPQRA